MNWIEKITEFLIKVRHFLTTHPKMVASSLISLLACSAVAFAVIYYYQEQQKTEAEEFYKFVFFELPKTEEQAERQAKTQAQIAKTDSPFLNLYLQLQALNQALSEKNKQQIEQLINTISDEKTDAVIQDILRLKLADAEIQIDRFDSALTRLGQIESNQLETMQSLLLAKAYQKKGDIQNARSILNTLATQNDDPAIKNMAEKLLLLL